MTIIQFIQLYPISSSINLIIFWVGIILAFIFWMNYGSSLGELFIILTMWLVAFAVIAFAVFSFEFFYHVLFHLPAF